MLALASIVLVAPDYSVGDSILDLLHQAEFLPQNREASPIMQYSRESDVASHGC